MDLPKSVLGSLFIFYGGWLGVCWTPKSKSGVSLTLSSACGTRFFLLSCFGQPWYEGLCILLRHACLMFLGGQLFSEGKDWQSWLAR